MAWAVPNVQRMEYVCGRAGLFFKVCFCEADKRCGSGGLKHVETDQEERIKTKIEELDRVLGGGIVPGSLLLVGGDPGIGKSTLLLQVCQRL